jgi:Icc-related predicted phosphoesterase
MVNLLVLSDLHVEFAPFEPDPAAVAAADVVVLPGDIHKGVAAAAWARAAFGDKPIIYVAGNHEFYGQKWFAHLEALRHASRKHGIHFLEDDSVDIAGIRFLGCSLWTDFELFGVERKPYAMRTAQADMNDFREIRVEKTRDVYWVRSGRLQPGLTVLRHRHSVQWLGQSLAGADPHRTVVVTHHAPHPDSVAAQFATDPLTPAYVSDLTRLMGKACLWLHGHMHDSCDYTIDGTRVVCNPRGYPLRAGGQFENDSFVPGLIVEVPGTDAKGR